MMTYGAQQKLEFVKDGKGNILRVYKGKELPMIQKLGRVPDFKTEAYAIFSQASMLDNQRIPVQNESIESEIRFYVGCESNWNYDANLWETSKLQCNLYTEQDCRYVMLKSYQIPKLLTHNIEYVCKRRALYAAFWTRSTTQ